MTRLHLLEEKLINSPTSHDLSITILSEYTQVEEYINTNNKIKYDIILLDRDCKAGGSFHVLDISKFSMDKIISISSVPEYNENAHKMGITKIVHKDYEDLDNFARKVEEIVYSMCTS
ncbi:MAG: hypothetical protein Q7R51_03310 [bacterium]|nr:hypothetical protein [bacterium]